MKSSQFSQLLMRETDMSQRKTAYFIPKLRCKSPDEDQLPPILTPKTQLSINYDSSQRYKTEASHSMLSNKKKQQVSKWVSIIRAGSKTKPLKTLDIYEVAVSILDEVLAMDASKIILDIYFRHLDNLLNIIKSLDCKDLLVRLNLLKVEMFKRRGDLYEALKIVTLIKHITESLQSSLIIKVYRYAGDLLISLKKYTQAKHNYLKMLYFAWYFDDEDKEFNAYEKLSLCYFYEASLDKSVVLHQWSMIGRPQPKGSQLRLEQYGLNRVQHHFHQIHVSKSTQLTELGQLNDSSSEEEDTAVAQMISEEKNIVNRKQVKQTPSRLIMHCSNNRHKSNHQIFGFKDIISKAVNKNQGFIFWSTENQIRYYKSKLALIRLALQQQNEEMRLI